MGEETALPGFSFLEAGAAGATADRQSVETRTVQTIFFIVSLFLSLRRRASPEEVQRLDGAGLVRPQGKRPLEERDGPLPVPQARLEERQVVQGRGVRSLRFERGKLRERARA